jgi:hypothetical protein
MMFNADPTTQQQILAELLRRRQDVGAMATRNVGKLATGIGGLSNIAGQGMAGE